MDAWLPAYRDSLVFMALIFPMAVYEGKMALLINTYLKALRMERQIFKINVFVMVCSFLTTLVCAIWMKNLNLTVLSIVFLLGLRSLIAERVLARKLKIEVEADIRIEFLMTLVFIVSGWFLPIYLGGSLYLVVYLVYVAFKYRTIKGLFGKLKKG